MEKYYSAKKIQLIRSGCAPQSGGCPVHLQRLQQGLHQEGHLQGNIFRVYLLTKLSILSHGVRYDSSIIESTPIALRNTFYAVNYHFMLSPWP